MPNNGIISKYAALPNEFKVSTTNDFDNSTDTIVVNKALNGITVEQKAVTLNQLAGMVGGGTQGPQGVQGPQGPTGPVAPAGLTWGGEYAPETDYAFNEVLTWMNPATDVLGSYWVTNPNGVYSVNPTDSSGNINEGWAFLASQGPRGNQGPQGLQGITGPQGPAGTAVLPYKEIFLRTTFGVMAQFQVGYNSNNISLSAQSAEEGSFSIKIVNSSDYPASAYKIQVSANIEGDFGDVYTVICESVGTSATGYINFSIKKFSSGSWIPSYPPQIWHPVYIRIYN
jgi:hypothetical protein